MNHCQHKTEQVRAGFFSYLLNWWSTKADYNCILNCFLKTVSVILD